MLSLMVYTHNDQKYFRFFTGDVVRIDCLSTIKKADANPHLDWGPRLLVNFSSPGPAGQFNLIFETNEYRDAYLERIMAHMGTGVEV